MIRDFVESLHMPPIGVVLLFIVILMILGCILDSTSILLLTTPLMCPIMVNEIFAGSMWFLVAIIIVDLLCVFVPQIVLFLPNAM